MRKIILFLTLLISFSLHAQQKHELKGRLVDAATNEPLKGITITLENQRNSIQTNDDGTFHIRELNEGADNMLLNATNIVSQELAIDFTDETVLDMKDIKVTVTQSQNNAGLINIVDESFLDDEGSSSQISSTIIMSNDIYLNQAGYQLSPFRFKVRGYDNRYQEKYINGVAFNDQNRGMFNYSSIGALNDVTRNGDAVNYYSPNSFTFGNIGGSENINMRAADYSRGGKVTLSYTNKNYYMRGMGSYSTGLMDDGYAFTAAIGGRYADEGQTPGTFYRNVSYALGMEKQWNDGKHRISFMTFGSPVERGQQHASYQEIYDLVGDNQYNPDWGYQNGKKRNSRVVKAFDPTAVLSHTWKINEKATLITGLGAHYQRYGQTALNWYNGSDPRPDYYRYLPSYYAKGTEDYERYTNLWRNKNSSITQVDWDGMYAANQESVRLGEPGANYMLEERRSDLMEASFNSTFNLDIDDKSRLVLGLGLRTTQSKQFKTVKDLLGSGYVSDYDKFAARDGFSDEFQQNDLDYYLRTGEARKVGEGDKFGYNFRLNINSANVWLQKEHKLDNIDIYYGTKFTYTDFSRDGKMRNGRYPENSLGKGKTHKFMDYALKTGFTYKFSGRHFLSANASFQTEAPLPNDAYITPRYSDMTRNLESSKIFAADINYTFSLPKWNGRISAFHTNFVDMMKRASYYDDSDRGKTFVHLTMQGMNMINRGFEFGVAYSLNDNWSFDFMGTVAEYFYSNNPTGITSFENNQTPDDIEGETVYLKDYYVGNTPQIAGVFGINYFNDFWFLNLKLNTTARNYIDIAPIRRLAYHYETINPNDPSDMNAYNKLTGQERYGTSYTVDFSVGKIFFLPHGNRINMNFAFNNILNRKNVKTGGYEQGRINLEYPDRFNSKYFYMQGFNCFLNASYLF